MRDMEKPNSDIILPVVIVGKDRTRMVCAVIDHIKAHLKNAVPYFICVSDRSRAGHDKVVENHLREIGETEYQVLRTLPEENRYGWGAAINIGLACAFDECKGAVSALVVDNDWLLQRDLDYDKYLYAFMSSDIGAITFKPVYGGTNIEVKEVTLSDGSQYLKRLPVANNGRYSFTAEIGCMLITRTMVETAGRFKENCRTDETEWGFCDWYNGLTGEERTDGLLWFATDKDMNYSELNGDGHVFTHVGIESQHEGPHKWDCPEEYKYLSDAKEDERVCKVAQGEEVKEMVGLMKEEKDYLKRSKPENFWGKNKVLFATNFITDPNCPLYESIRILKEIAAGAEVYVSSDKKFGREAFHDIFNYAIDNDYSYIIYADADCFIVNKQNLEKEFIAFLETPDAMFSGCSDGGMFFHRCGNPWVINPFLLFVRVSKIKSYRNQGKEFMWGEKQVLTEHQVANLTSDTWGDATRAFSQWRKIHGIVPAAKEISQETDGAARFWFGQHRQIYTCNISSLNFEPYYDIFLGCQSSGRESIRFMYGADYQFDADRTGICSAIFHFPKGSTKDYEDESKLICIHTWFSRVYLKTPDTGNDALRKWQSDRIDKVIGYCKKFFERNEAQESKINWNAYFDRIYCTNFLPLTHRAALIKEELKRVGILDSGIFEWRYNCPRIYDEILFRNAPKLGTTKPAYVNQMLGLQQILEEAKAFGYENILVIEDDAIFLKDKKEIKKILDSLPEGYSIVQLDKAVHEETVAQYAKDLISRKINERFIESSGEQYNLSTINAYSRKGILEACAILNKGLLSCDQIAQKTSRSAVAIKNLAVQYFEESSAGVEGNLAIVTWLHDMYQRQGIDYKDYNFPKGYDYGSVYTTEMNEIPNGDNKIETSGSPLEGELATPNIMRSEPAQHQGLCDLIASLGRTHLKVLEIGSFAGDSAEVFLSTGRVDKITCIDPWEDREDENPHNTYTQMQSIESIFDAKMRQFEGKVHKHKGTLETFIREGLERAERFDLVYIDALHDYDNVKKDIINTLTYIRPSIAIAGHDYNPNLPGVAGVKQAVDEIFGSEIQTFCDTSWLYSVDKSADTPLRAKPVKKGRKFISVYAIAKNESSVAKRWYECVKEADEVCVLDTGSTDDTVKILRDLGAHVEVKTYDDWSFAVARNDSMKLVSPESEILFTLDLDETIAPGWRKKLEDAWIAEEEKGNNPVGCTYKYIWSWRPDGTEAQSFSIRKIHANGMGQWRYRCHELLVDVNGYTFFLDRFVVEHHQNRQTNRSKYLPLLEKDAREMPDDDRSAYYYARELMYGEKWIEAKKEFQRHLSLPTAGWRAERASSMRNIAKCYENLKSDDKRELWLWKAAEEDPTNREATYQLGLMAMEKKDYRTAVKVFKKCVSIEKPSLEYISDPIVWTSHPWFLYSQALWWVGCWDDAVNACKKALAIEPNNNEVKAQLAGMTETRDKYNK